MNADQHPVDTDKDGKPVENSVSVALMELRDHSDSAMVLCAYHETGRIQYFDRGSIVTGDLIRAARECGYEVDHVTTRHRASTSLAGEEGRVGYAEFTPVEE